MKQDNRYEMLRDYQEMPVCVYGNTYHRFAEIKSNKINFYILRIFTQIRIKLKNNG